MYKLTGSIMGSSLKEMSIISTSFGSTDWAITVSLRCLMSTRLLLFSLTIFVEHFDAVSWCLECFLGDFRESSYFASTKHY